MPAVALNVTAPRIGYITEAASEAAAAFRGRGGELHAELRQRLLGIGQHVHQVGDRRALVAADVADPALQQRLGERQDTLAAELLARSELEILHFPAKDRSAMLTPPALLFPTRSGPTRAGHFIYKATVFPMIAELAVGI